MNPALRHVWAKPSRLKILHGGRASSKSWDAAANLVRVMRSVKVGVCCTRMFQNKIQESVYKLIKKQIERFGFSAEFEILNTVIRHRKTGSEVVFLGLKRNIEEIKSLEGIDILWIEEAANLTQEMWEILEPTIRAAFSEIWIVFNPRFATDFVYKNFVANPQPDSIVQQINYPDNPFLSATLLKSIEALKLRDPDTYTHVYLGVPLSSDDKTIIKTEWVEACLDAHEKLGIEIKGTGIVGYDVADDGGDKNALVRQRGGCTFYIEEWKGLEDELLISATRVYNEANLHDCEIVYDCIGVGAAQGARFKELNDGKPRSAHVDYHPFDAGGEVADKGKQYMPKIKNEDHFENLKAQCWQDVANKMLATYNRVVRGIECADDEIISISSKIPLVLRNQLRDELCTPFKAYSARGSFMVEKKVDMKKRGVKSPNLADAYIMANSKYTIKRKMRAGVL